MCLGGGVAAGTGIVAMSACTGESSFALPAWDAMAPSTDFQGPCTSWAQSKCAYEARCYDPIGMQWISSDQCVARETINCELAASDPAIPFDPAAVAGCQYPTDCGAPPGFCLDAGKLPVRATCQSSYECATGFCDFTNAQCGGRCQDLPLGCEVQCPAGQTCALEADASVQTCVPVPAIGEPCPAPGLLAGSIPCVQGATCAITGNGTGTCVPLAGEDASCSLTDPAGAVCFEPGLPLFCDSTQHCRQYRVASYLQPCGLDEAGDYYQCIGWGSCAYTATPVCVPPAADGMLCDVQQGLYCLPPANCIGNRCLFPSVTASCTP
jgi:hypothetical protein